VAWVDAARSSGGPRDDALNHPAPPPSP
jgi:hypothetical protein